MLHQFLMELSDGRSRNLAEVARDMDISPLMAARMAEDLTRLGYLQKLGVRLWNAGSFLFRLRGLYGLQPHRPNLVPDG